MSLISSVRHPYWGAKTPDWFKWRSVYDGGELFVDHYLQKFSDRETSSDFTIRKAVTPTPNFAKAAINDIRNAIFQRLADVSRRDGSKSYVEAVRGIGFGVDLHGSSMNAFLGKEVIAELLTMSRVGIFVDMPQITGKTLRDAVGKRPYIYRYRAEDICCYTYKPGSPEDFTEVLLRDYVEVYATGTSLQTGVKERYRYMFIGEEGKVHVRFYEKASPEYDDLGNEIPRETQVDVDGNPTTEDLILDCNIIPFHMAEISDSLLADVANHQIALLNMESSDVSYALRSNFPFYVEQGDPRQDLPHLRGGSASSDGTASDANTAKGDEIRVGGTKGRRYGKDLDAPSFINPSSEPLVASMKKQSQLKDDIRVLVNLNLSTMGAQMASAESKQMDERGLDSGLSYIGLVLENAERRIATFWHSLEKQGQPASVKYPEKWSLKTDSERREDAKVLRELRDTIPSPTFQHAVSKEIAFLIVGNKVSPEDLDKIASEIDKAETYTSDPETIFRGVELGILDLKSAATILGWPEEVVEKAAKEHAARLARIAESQAQANPQGDGGARGVGDLDASPGQSGKDEKADSRDNTTDADPSKKVRGDAKEKANL